MTRETYHFETDLKADEADKATNATAADTVGRVARVAPIARGRTRQHVFAPGSQALTQRLAPAALVLIDLMEDDTLAGRACEQLGTALLILADVAEDDELGLTGATPEQKAAKRPGSFEVMLSSGAQFDSVLFTPYVRAIYTREIEAVRLAPDHRRKRQLARSARTLAQIVAAGALPLEHVRTSLLVAANLLTADDGLQVIDQAFHTGLREPRKLPEARRRP